MNALFGSCIFELGSLKFSSILSCVGCEIRRLDVLDESQLKVEQGYETMFTKVIHPRVTDISYVKHKS